MGGMNGTMNANENLRYYNALREVPPEARKPITAGRLKGMTDISPMWRIKAMTEQFGPCGVGWCYSEPTFEYVAGNDSEIMCIARTSVQVNVNGEWSIAIPGVGGSRFVTKEKGGLYTDDEAPKKALTDALSVAMKALGVGADVYFAKDSTKYTAPEEPEPNEPEPPQIVACTRCGKPITGVKTKDKTFTAAEIVGKSKAAYGACYCWDCMIALKAAKDGSAK